MTNLRNAIISDKLSKPGGHFAHANEVPLGDAGRLIFISGLTARGSNGAIMGIGDPYEQTRQVCQNLAHVMEEFGGTLDHICRMDVFVRNMEHFEQIHKARREFFGGAPSSSTMVEINKMVDPDMLIEINAIAMIGND